jgi:hypothetical protein
MPHLTGTHEVRYLIDFLYGRENSSTVAIAALARHVRAYVRTRPCVGFSDPIPWATLEELRTNIRNYGPGVTMAEFDEAVATFRES